MVVHEVSLEVGKVSSVVAHVVLPAVAVDSSMVVPEIRF